MQTIKILRNTANYDYQNYWNT